MHSRKIMRRLYRKGEHVRSKIDGKVMEVLKYIKKNLVEVMWFDLEKKEPRKNTIREDKLSKAAWCMRPPRPHTFFFRTPLLRTNVLTLQLGTINYCYQKIWNTRILPVIVNRENQGDTQAKGPAQTGFCAVCPGFWTGHFLSGQAFWLLLRGGECHWNQL